jgi:hypothetical protein
MGVDRGVLYTVGNPGVAWTGLISISERPSGGVPRPYFLDGIKYLNLASAEEFEATINALGCPPEFLACDGVVAIHTGLYATQQRRQPFNLSYRTLVGNDISGFPGEYKIHLVYNGLAAPSQVSNTTIGDGVEPTAFSWSITTLPPDITGYRRTAHLVIDSRYTDPDVLSDVEDILYGTDDDAPSIPTPDELIAIFA